MLTEIGSCMTFIFRFCFWFISRLKLLPLHLFQFNYFIFQYIIVLYTVTHNVYTTICTRSKWFCLKLQNWKICNIHFNRLLRLLYWTIYRWYIIQRHFQSPLSATSTQRHLRITKLKFLYNEILKTKVYCTDMLLFVLIYLVYVYGASLLLESTWIPYCSVGALIYFFQ